MKKLIIILNIFLFAEIITAQQTQFVNDPFPKTITVSGSAEMEIVPDEIYVNITLREYQKKGEAKKEIESIKTAFLENCRAVGIPDSTISIFSFSGYNNYFHFKKRKKDPDMQSSITYQVKFKDSKTMDDLVEKLDDEATQNFIIASTSHSKITEYRKQLKINAVQSAKNKGIYLTDAIGEKLGEAIKIKEPGENIVSLSQLSSQMSVRSNSLSSNLSYRGKLAEDYYMSEVDFKKIRLRFEVEVVFALK